MDKNAQRNLASLLYKSLPAGPPPPKPPRTFKYVPRSHFEETPDGSEWFEFLA